MIKKKYVLYNDFIMHLKCKLSKGLQLLSCKIVITLLQYDAYHQESFLYKGHALLSFPSVSLLYSSSSLIWDFSVLGRWRRSMGRRSVRLTFSKRRVGLLKKSHEISVRCDADVALIVFSSKGKLYEYSTDSRMERILERYERYYYAEEDLIINEPKSQEDLCDEYGKLKRKFDALQRSHSHLMGENLDTLSLKELQQLELQLGTALKHIRSQMNQLLLDSIAELQRKEKSLVEHRAVLEKKIIENEKGNNDNTAIAKLHF